MPLIRKIEKEELKGFEFKDMVSGDSIIEVIYQIVELALTKSKGECVDVSDIVDNLVEIFGTDSFDNWIGSNLRVQDCCEGCDNSAYIDWQ